MDRGHQAKCQEKEEEDEQTELIQCRPCMQLGLTLVDCPSVRPSCGVCAEPHCYWTSDCIERMSRGRSIKRKCVLCEEKGILALPSNALQVRKPWQQSRRRPSRPNLVLRCIEDANPSERHQAPNSHNYGLPLATADLDLCTFETGSGLC